MKKLFVLLILILLIAAGIVYYKNWRNDFLQKKVPELVFLKSDSLYRITYDNIDIDEVDGEIVIKNLKLIPDSTYKKPGDSTLPADLLQVIVSEVHVTGIQTDDALINKEIIAGQIKLTNPVVTMFNNHRKVNRNNTNGKDNTPTTDKIYKVLLRGLEKIKVDTILIIDADYHICDWKSGDTSFSGKKINAQLHHLNISDSTSTDTSRILFAEQTALTVDKILIRSKKGIYNYRFNDIQLQSDEKTFTVKNMHIIPLLGEAAFMRAAKTQTDRLDFDFYNIKFKQINIPELLNGNMIAGELSIGEAQFKIFRDKSYPDKGQNRVGAYPHQLFLKIPVDVAINKVFIHSGRVEYKEKNPQTGSSGEVIFNDVQATLQNVTNHVAFLNKNAVCILNFDGRLLNKVPLSARLQFYINSNQGKFTINGTTGPADASMFNRLTKPMALVEINSGTINRLDFNLTCNDYKANGTIRLLYEDLKVKLLKVDEAQNEYEIKKVASLLANIGIINNNPAKNKPERVITVSHARNPNKSMFNLIWKSILEGLQKTVGIEGKLPT